MIAVIVCMQQGPGQRYRSKSAARNSLCKPKYNCVPTVLEKIHHLKCWKMHLTHCTINIQKDKYKIYRKIRKVSLRYGICFSWLSPSGCWAVMLQLVPTLQKCSRQVNIKMMMCHIRQVFLNLATVKGQIKLFSCALLEGLKKHYLVWPPFASHSTTQLSSDKVNLVHLLWSTSLQ